jgi:hypothetical protein
MNETLATGIPVMSKSKHYVNNADFLIALNEYNEICEACRAAGKTEPNIPNYIGECFLKIATHLARKPNFISYSFREEMIGDGIENCMMYFRNFDPTKSSNPFAYFTQIIYFAFLRRIQKEKKQLYVKYKATEQFGLLDEGEMYEDSEGNMKQFVLYDNISEFILTFEEKKAAKKKTKAKGLDKFIEPDIIEDIVLPEELTDDGEFE